MLTKETFVILTSHFKRKLNTAIRMSSNIEKQKLAALAESYKQKGFGVLENFLTEGEIQNIKDETVRLIRTESRSENNKLQIFGNEFNMKSRYFLDSSDKICYFFEKNAVDWETFELLMPEEQSLAKIAHALHCLNPVFNKVTTSNKVQEVYRALGYIEPTVVQSMIIFKNPKLGGAYTPHQDASFLHCDPPEHLVGLWMALDDATPENGCLEFIPGSHRWPLARRLVRTGNTQDGESLLEWTAPVRQDKPEQFLKVPVKRGDLVLIHGHVVHQSAENLSNKSRWAYTFHAYDKARGRYSDQNWLQINVNNTFMPVFSKTG